VILTDAERAVLEAIVALSGRSDPDGSGEIPWRARKRAWRPESTTPGAGVSEYSAMPRAAAELIFGPELIAHMIARPCELLAVWPLDPPLVTLSPYGALQAGVKLVTSVSRGRELGDDDEMHEVLFDVSWWALPGYEVRQDMPRMIKEFPRVTFDLFASPFRSPKDWHTHDQPPMNRRQKREQARREGLLRHG
jgi:hypothetical protein